MLNYEIFKGLIICSYLTISNFVWTLNKLRNGVKKSISFPFYFVNIKKLIEEKYWIIKKGVLVSYIEEKKDVVFIWFMEGNALS